MQTCIAPRSAALLQQHTCDTLWQPCSSAAQPVLEPRHAVRKRDSYMWLLATSYLVEPQEGEHMVRGTESNSQLQLLESAAAALPVSTEIQPSAAPALQCSTADACIFPTHC